MLNRTRLPIIVLIATLVVGLVGVVPTTLAASVPQGTAQVSPALQANPWTAEYFNNRTFTAPGIVGPSIPGGPLSLNWGLNSPIGGINADNFSSRFTSTVNFPVGGNVDFEARGDDTVTVRVDGVAVTASATVFVDTTYRGSVTLTPGFHTIVVEHTDIEREAYVSVTWSGGGGVVSPTGVTGTVLAFAGLRFRDGPSLTANRIGTLPFGQTYAILGRSADNFWAYLESNGVRGWAYASLLNMAGNFTSLPVVNAPSTPAPVPGTPVVNASPIFTMRVRSGPSTDSPQIGRVVAGSTVGVFGQSSDGLWIRIRFLTSTGATLDGWSFKQFYRDPQGQLLSANLPVVQ